MVLLALVHGPDMTGYNMQLAGSLPHFHLISLYLSPFAHPISVSLLTLVLILLHFLNIYGKDFYLHSTSSFWSTGVYDQYLIHLHTIAGTVTLPASLEVWYVWATLS